MNKFVYLTCASKYDCSSTMKDNELKAHLKKIYQFDTRRLSRLTLLALAGALPLAEKCHQQTSIYTAAQFGSTSVFQSMMENVFAQSVAKPFDLLAYLHNAPSFHVAAAIKSVGETVFQAININGDDWQKPLRCAINDIIVGATQQVLLGWCFETNHTEISQEGSVWVLLEDQPQENSIAINQDTITFPETHDDYIKQVTSWLNQHKVRWLVAP